MSVLLHLQGEEDWWPWRKVCSDRAEYADCCVFMSLFLFSFVSILEPNKGRIKRETKANVINSKVNKDEIY